MYKLDRTNNAIAKLEQKAFSALGFSERQHLQEWLVSQPEALGEELLIIQKEFDGSDDTRERLDVLALDKDGNLVVIENKLDDTGRDVVWQALKYASYCSGLSKSQVVTIFQQYLDRYCGGGEATALICEFLDVPELEEAVINSGNNQRLMLVAANFRKEVTSTALWLLTKGVQVQCFRVTPFSLGEELLLNIVQIIPTPEASELMIGISAKEADEKQAEVAVRRSHRLRLAFWEEALEAFQNSDCRLYDNISPGKDHWLSAGSGLSACPYCLIFGKKEIRVQVDFVRSNRDENKAIFDTLERQKAAIEQAFGAPLTWLRLDEKKASRIQFAKPVDGYDRENWPAMITWMVEHMTRIEQAFKEPLAEVNVRLKNGSLIRQSSLGDS